MMVSILRIRISGWCILRLKGL